MTPAQRPLCACGCGQRAFIVADVLVDGAIDCRQPWANPAHALGAYDDETCVEVSVVVTSRDLPVIVDASPCWCAMREHTTCDWCPKHGNVGARVYDAEDRSLASTQPLPAICDAEASADLDARASNGAPR